MVAYARGHVIKNLSFIVDSVDYSNQVTKVRLVPEQNTQTLRVGVPSGTLTDTDGPVWSLELSGIQDNGSGSLGAALRTAAAADATVDVEYQPVAGVGQDLAEFTIKPTFIPFGGDVGAFRTFDATFPVSGDPAFSQSV